jgi:hypothetical protein
VQSKSYEVLYSEHLSVLRTGSAVSHFGRTRRWWDQEAGDRNTIAREMVEMGVNVSCLRQEPVHIVSRHTSPILSSFSHSTFLWVDSGGLDVLDVPVPRQWPRSSGGTIADLGDVIMSCLTVSLRPVRHWQRWRPHQCRCLNGENGCIILTEQEIFVCGR